MLNYVVEGITIARARRITDIYAEPASRTTDIRVQRSACAYNHMRNIRISVYEAYAGYGAGSSPDTGIGGYRPGGIVTTYRYRAIRTQRRTPRYTRG